MDEERLVMSGFREEDDDQESSLRPKTLREYVGQQAVKEGIISEVGGIRQAILKIRELAKQQKKKNRK